MDERQIVASFLGEVYGRTCENPAHAEHGNEIEDCLSCVRDVLMPELVIYARRLKETEGGP